MYVNVIRNGGINLVRILLCRLFTSGSPNMSRCYARAWRTRWNHRGLGLRSRREKGEREGDALAHA